jgi:hypothetical protein
MMAVSVGEGAREEDALLLPSRELADLAVPKGAHAHPIEGRECKLAITRTREAEEVHVPVAAHHHHIPDAHGKGPVHLLGLRHIGHELCLARRGRREPRDANVAPGGP